MNGMADERINLAVVKRALKACSNTFQITILELIGCGDFGCVFRTADPTKVLKIGNQWNEYHASKYLLENNNMVNVKFPKIYTIWDLNSCFPKISLYAILRENIDNVKTINEAWFNEVTADLEFLCERYSDTRGGITDDNVFEISAQILEERPGTVADELQFEKLIEFYAWCIKRGILLTDTLLENFGQRDDGTLVLRDLGGVYLPNRH